MPSTGSPQSQRQVRLELTEQTGSEQRVDRAGVCPASSFRGGGNRLGHRSDRGGQHEKQPVPSPDSPVKNPKPTVCLHPSWCACINFLVSYCRHTCTLVGQGVSRVLKPQYGSTGLHFCLTHIHAYLHARHISFLSIYVYECLYDNTCLGMSNRINHSTIF